MKVLRRDAVRRMSRLMLSAQSRAQLRGWRSWRAVVFDFSIRNCDLRICSIMPRNC